MRELERVERGKLGNAAKEAGVTSQTPASDQELKGLLLSASLVVDDFFGKGCSGIEVT